MNAEFEKASLLKETNVGYSNASRPIARVAGYYAGRCVIQPLDPASVLPEGLALYVAAPPAQPDAALVEALAASLDECIKEWDGELDSKRCIDFIGRAREALAAYRAALAGKGAAQ